MSLLPRNASNKYGIFPYVITISIVAILVAGFVTYLITGGDKISTAIFTSIVAAFIVIVLLISRELWMESKSKFRVRMATVGIALTTIIAYTGWQQTIQDILAKYLHIENLGNAVHPAIVFTFAAFVIWCINYFNRDNTAMGIHPNPLDIPEPDFVSRMIMVTESLTEDLKTIDKTTNWSIQLFTPLDAEVELRSEGNETQKKVTDLLKAIKSMKRERLFLVLGDPGSGKSVALRKLCRELALEVVKTKKIPVYINLKEWQVEQKWDENNPPTVEQLNAFVLRSLKSRDIVSTKFFEKYYDALYENGQLYFIFDSFDEIPSVLDEKDKSPLIQQLSNVMFKFLKGARQDSQGILASRIFRKPTEDFQTQTTLEIRPFSDEKIEQTLRRSNQFSPELIKELFKERTDLVPVARNPFMAALIANYAENNNNELPRNQSDLYESYIRNALKTCQDLIKKRGLTERGIVQSAIAMADTMFRNYGLEAPIKELKEKLDIQNLEETIEVLKFARIGRVGTGDENMFSFTHRRFCEYFAVQKLLQENTELDLNTIPEDSQWRDALVLYCEVADEAQSQKIANFCWDIIKNSTNPYDLRVIHCLRFLQDAFKGRLECIADFREELTEYVLSRINTDNIIITKLAVESLGLMKDADIEKGVVQAFNLQNEWINETAFKACRHLDDTELPLKEKIADYIYNLPEKYAFKRYREISFSLQLSKAFEYAHKCLNFKLVEFTSLVALLVLSTITYFTTLPNYTRRDYNLEQYYKIVSEEKQIDSLIQESTDSLIIITLEETKNQLFINSTPYILGWLDEYNKIKAHDILFKIICICACIILINLFYLNLSIILDYPIYTLKYLVYISKFSVFLILILLQLLPMIDVSRSYFLINILLLVFLISSNLRIIYDIAKYLLSIKFISLNKIIKFIREGIINVICFISKLPRFFVTIILGIIKIFKQLHIATSLFIVFYIILTIFVMYTDINKHLDSPINKNIPLKQSILFTIWLSPMLAFGSIGILTPIFKFIKNTYIDYHFFKTINLNKCNNRSYISDMYLKLRTRRYKKRFLKHLENNVRQATGEWADPKILMLDNSEETIRLAKLEEKWLGLNK